MEHALRRAAFLRDRARAFPARPSTPALPSRNGRSRRSPSSADAPTFANTVDALEMSGAALRRVSRVFFNLTGAAHQRSAGEDRTRHRAGPRQAPIGHLSERGALPPRRRAEGATRRRSAFPPSRGACCSACISPSSARARRSTPGEEEAAGGDHRAARGARHAVRSERARRRARLHAASRSGCGSRRAVGGADRIGGEGGLRARHAKESAQSPSRAPRSSRSCSSRAAATSARRRSGRGSRAGRMAARPTTARSSPRRCGCAPSAPSSSATRTSRPTASTTRWRRRPKRRSISSTPFGRERGEKAKREAEALQTLVQSEGGNFALAPWDWRYYAEKRRKAEFDFDEGALKPYLQLDRMIEAAFYTAGRLFGLVFTPRDDVPVYHPRRARLGGHRCEGPPCRPVPRRLFRPPLEAERRLDERLSQPGEARRRHPSDRRQRDELLQGRRWCADPCSASRTRGRSSTSSATGCTGSSRT